MTPAQAEQAYQRPGFERRQTARIQGYTPLYRQKRNSLNATHGAMLPDGNRFHPAQRGIDYRESLVIFAPHARSFRADGCRRGPDPIHIRRA